MKISNLTFILGVMFMFLSFTTHDDSAAIVLAMLALVLFSCVKLCGEDDK